MKFFFLITLFLISTSLAENKTKKPDRVTAVEVDFSSQILPILSDKCFKCHGPDKSKREAELRLDTKEGLLAKLDDSFVVKPGELAKSQLWSRIISDDEDEQMPPQDSKLSLTDKEKKLIAAWIKQGAKWKRHWAFEPIQRPKRPMVKNNSWVKNEIDYFVLKKLEEQGQSPSEEATKRELIRRLSLDLTGLPPSIAEVDAFLKDKSPQAYEKVVDRLFASTRYGERMAWPWLDAARYSDTNGFQADPTRTMWPWRDWVIKAMNNNMPFDQFTIEQLAGDLITNATLSQRVATGFNRNHTYNGEGGRIPEETRVENVLDRVETTGTTWLGLTMLCMRCHDHKYDPLTKKDYYSMYAFFNNTSEKGALYGNGQIPPVVTVPISDKHLSTSQKTQRQKLQNQLKQAEERFAKIKLKDPSHAELLKKLKQAKDELKKFKQRLMVKVMIMDDLKKPRESHILIGGSYEKKSDKVTANTPVSLPNIKRKGPYNRMDLARWIVSPENPLTARVAVNRYWQIFFGDGIVSTQENFGTQASKPTHPKLLDWLATEFIKRKWNVKAIHKLMVMSATYRQSSKVSAEGLKWDPKNRFLGRGPRYRLPSWMIRDQALAVSGLLVEKIGGPAVRPYQPPGLWAEATFGKIKYKQDKGEKLYRRTLYTFWRRIIKPSNLFDVANRQVCEVKVARTNSPLHALITMNDTTYVEAARVLAQRSIKAVGPQDANRIQYIYQLLLARGATQQELTILEKRLGILKANYLKDPKSALALLKVGQSPRDEKLNVSDHAALSALTLMILNLDESLSKQ